MTATTIAPVQPYSGNVSCVGPIYDVGPTFRERLSVLDRHSKQFISMRYWLLGAAKEDKAYYVTLEAMEYAASFHTGLRKDDVTPEFNHQLSIAHYIRTLLPSLRHPAESLATIFLHDVCEGYDVGFDEIGNRFGQVICRSTRLMTKKHRGVIKPRDLYFGELAEDPIASVDKGGDRIHNLQTMNKARWTVEKQQAYVDEGRTDFLPMLKKARRNFPDQEMAYENIKHVLCSQIELIEASLEAQRAA